MASARIARVAKADKGRTMMHASVANEVIDAVNEHDLVTKAMKAAKVSPESAGNFLWSDANMVLKLNGVGGKPGIITGAVNGVPSTATIPFITPWVAI